MGLISRVSSRTYRRTVFFFFKKPKMGRQSRRNRMSNGAMTHDVGKSLLMEKTHLNSTKNESNNIVKYSQCQATFKKLKDPIVVSKMGRLYNKEAVLKHLLLKVDKSQVVDPGVIAGGSTGKVDDHDPIQDIKSTKDIYQLKDLTKNPNYTENPTVDKDIATPSKFPFLCPITGVEMNGSSGKFVFGLNSKALVSEKALRECNVGLLGHKGTNQADSSNNPLYNQANEEKLMCPVKSIPFGRPIVLYPNLEEEIERAKDFVVSSAGKKKRKNKDKEEGKSKDPDQKTDKTGPSKNKIFKAMPSPSSFKKTSSGALPGRTPHLTGINTGGGVNATPGRTPARGGFPYL